MQQQSRSRTLRATFAALGAAAAVVALSTGPAAASDAPFQAPKATQATARSVTSAAAGCAGAGPTVTNHLGITYSTTYCHNYQAGYVVRADQPSVTNYSGYLNAGDNWFVCQRQITAWENPPVGSARNNWWLYTQGDDGYADAGWGWFPATKVSGGGNYQPIPGLRTC
ncbi:hypothetical protein [Streptomyces sp. NPDC046862]|uniref:hypothetical protein n=1 Tax=Streptomyces sp. NPDC046862 TaxID=3154603 RepID=UPI003456C2C7